MAGSLLDNEDFSSIGSSGGSKKGGSSDSGTKIKVGVIAVCLLGAGGLFAMQMGMFDKKPKDTRSQEQIQEDTEQFEEQKRIREKLKTLPEYQQGDA